MITLRPFQIEALNALEQENDRHVLCIAPTGSGKSLIYERAAAQPNRKTLLVTPLVALARQQAQKLRDLGVPTFLGAGGAGQKPQPNQSGAWIVSPEILQTESGWRHLQNWRPQFLVVDECHCLWEWGEDFRPAFQIIPQILNIDFIQKSLWLTATLPLEARLHLKKRSPSPFIELGQFELPKNLHITLHQIALVNRPQALLNWLSQQQGTGIIFVSTREWTQRLARLLSAFGKRTVIYHGGMSREERKNVEKLIVHKIPDIIVATSAFGMGMDYEHLTTCVLWQIPTSILALVQTIGRVGRSNSLGKSLIFWDFDDFKMLEWTIQNSKKRRIELMHLHNFLKSHECRRIGLRRYFDTNCNLTNCGTCDYCNVSGKNQNLPLA